MTKQYLGSKRYKHKENTLRKIGKSKEGTKQTNELGERCKRSSQKRRQSYSANSLVIEKP